MTDEPAQQETELDWVQCGDPKFCEIMADAPPPELVQMVQNWTSIDFDGDRDWLSNWLERFSGPPGLVLKLFFDRPETPVDNYAFLMTVPLPNSYNPAEVFPVGRLGYSMAAAIRDEKLLAEEVYQLACATALHEVREWFKFDGSHIHDPHPPVKKTKKKSFLHV